MAALKYKAYTAEIQLKNARKDEKLQKKPYKALLST